MDHTVDQVDDVAADQSLARLVSEGRYLPQQEETFDYFWYWDTLDELQEYEGERVHIPETSSAEVQQLLASCDRIARLRTRSTIIIARYGKQGR